MHPKKRQHKKQHRQAMTYGGVVVPGMPSWEYYGVAGWTTGVGSYGSYGGGEITGQTGGDNAGYFGSDGGSTTSGM